MYIRWYALCCFLLVFFQSCRQEFYLSFQFPNQHAQIQLLAFYFLFLVQILSTIIHHYYPQILNQYYTYLHFYNQQEVHFDHDYFPFLCYTLVIPSIHYYISILFSILTLPTHTYFNTHPIPPYFNHFAPFSLNVYFFPIHVHIHIERWYVFNYTYSYILTQYYPILST